MITDRKINKGKVKVKNNFKTLKNNKSLPNPSMCNQVQRYNRVNNNNFSHKEHSNLQLLVIALNQQVLNNHLRFYKNPYKKM